MVKVFIDGQQGTTGLQIRDRLLARADITLLEIPDEKRKDLATKREYLNSADLVVLCLPDNAARESVALIDNKTTRVIDASTAHRIAPDWVYGMPELSGGQRARVQSATRVANPGCHATGFVLAIAPLVAKGIVPADYPVTTQSITGYSGGGKSMIRDFESHDRDELGSLACRPYALALAHKHLPEMTRYSGLQSAPLFMPCLGDFYAGMIVSVPLWIDRLTKRVGTGDIREMLAAHYEGEPFVKVAPYAMANLPDGGLLSPTANNGTNRLDVFVFGNDIHVLVCTRFDNLGKGASGAAVQNLNVMFRLNETEGLV